MAEMDGSMPAHQEPQAPGPARGSSAESRQFVIFFVRGESFAVPLAEVQEIIRMPEVVRLPLSPPGLEGLANLRGTVLPILNLRHIFRFEMALHDDSTRVVVLDQGQPVGLIVDRMANVVTVEADQIESSNSIQGTVDSDLIAGMIKNVGDQAMVMILDAGKLVQKEFRGFTGRRAAGGLGNGAEGAAEPARTANGQTAAANDEIQLVSFQVAGQEYALPIEHVQEIVQIPETLTHVPNAQNFVLGIMSLRNRLLPLVGLRDLFGLPSIELCEQHRIVVVSAAGSDGTGSSAVGVVMDSVNEVLRVSRTVVDPVPALLAREGNLQDITAICRLDRGRRLVSIISAERIVNTAGGTVAAAAGQGHAAMDQGLGACANTSTDDEEQVVVFRLLNEEYGVPIEMVQEIVRVPDELTRVPRTPAFIEGVVNLRGTVLPVIDQRRRFGLQECARNDRQRIMVFTIQGIRTGFIVDSVSEVMRIPRAAIGPAPNLSAEQRRLIKRVANLEQARRMILMLDVGQLLASQELKELAAEAA